MLADDGWKVDEDVKTSSGVNGQKNVGRVVMTVMEGIMDCREGECLFSKESQS